MSYELSLKRLPNFLRYVNKVYGFSQTVNAMQGNSDSQVSPQTIFMSVFLCLLLRQGMKRISEDFLSSFFHWKWRMSWVHFDGR